MPLSYDTLVVLGPTASGKTRLAAHLAARFEGEIVSADSRQVYRELTVGAGKDLGEYVVDGAAVPYHLIDVATLAEEYNLFRFQRDCRSAWTAIRERGRLPIIAGGTGLYIEAVLAGYALTEAPPDPARRAELEAMNNAALGALLQSLRPDLHNTTDLGERARIIRAVEIAEAAPAEPVAEAVPLRPLILGTQWPRDVLRERIRARLKARIGAGMIEETRDLLAAGVPAERLYLLGLEYRFTAAYIQGSIRTQNDLIQKLCAAIGQFAKRQETWFRRMERRGYAIHWLDGADVDAAAAIIEAAP